MRKEIRSIPESRYCPAGEDIARKMSIMEEIFNLNQEVLIKFLLSLPAPDQAIVSHEAQHVFLKNLDSLKILYQALDQDDQRGNEVEVHTIINGEDISGNQNEEIPPPWAKGQDDIQNEEDL